MTVFTLSLAGAVIRVEALYPSTQTYCRDYLTDAEPELSVSISQADIDFEREKSAQEDALEGLAPRHFSDAYLETLAVYRKLAKALLQRDALVFHGSVVAWEGKAYLFTALSGTGKTTHTRLWLKMIPGSYVLNGDKPLLRVCEDGVYACGTPWQGKERYGCNEILPLKAICLLERDNCNHIEPITFRDAMATLIQQSNRPSETELLLRTLDLIGRMDGRVRFYRLGCNMEDEAALVSFRGMTEERT